MLPPPPPRQTTANPKKKAEGKAGEVRGEERARARSQADRAALAAALAAARRQAAAAAEAADMAGIERELVGRGAQEGREACGRLRAAAATALAGKQAAQRALLERSEEMCALYERSAALQQELDAGGLPTCRPAAGLHIGRAVGAPLFCMPVWVAPSLPCAPVHFSSCPTFLPSTLAWHSCLTPARHTPRPAGAVALQQCGDDMRVLQLEAAELQRRVGATHRTAPNVGAHDRQVAALKADVLRAHREAEGLGAALESPGDSAERWRVLPGVLPTREDLAARAARIEERLAGRKDLAAQVGAGWRMAAGGVAGRGPAPVHACMPAGDRHPPACRVSSLALASEEPS